MKLEPQDVTVDLVEELSQLEPFGASNPSPIFELDNLKLTGKKLMGNDHSHLRLSLTSEASEFTAIRWKQGDIPLCSGDNMDIAFHPQVNEFNGNISVQLIIDDIHSDLLTDEDTTPKCNCKIYDNRTKTGILPEVNDYIKKSKYNIKVFAESKQIIDKIKPFDSISSKIFTRRDISKCDILMFFDYPADKHTLDTILEKAQPKGIHFMYYEPKNFDETDLLKTFTGMLKFASHNNNGKFELIRCASFLGKSVKIVEMLLNLYEKEGIIEILNKNTSFYTINFMNTEDFSKILNNKEYSQIFEMMLECEDFQRSLLEDDLEPFISV